MSNSKAVYIKRRIRYGFKRGLIEKTPKDRNHFLFIYSTKKFVLEKEIEKGWFVLDFEFCLRWVPNKERELVYHYCYYG